MKFLALILMATAAFASDNIINPQGSGKSYLNANDGYVYPLSVGYTTNGNSRILTINGATVAADDINIPQGSGNAYLTDNMSRLFPLEVLMTTDGNGNVIPITGGSGSGGITSLNALTGATQTFATGTAGSDFGISSSGTIHTFNLPTASATKRGLLSSADWSVFNGKQSALTLGNLSDVGTDGITVTAGSGAVVGSGTSLAQHVADSTHNGYLAQSDWSLFNGKQAALSFGNLTAAGFTVTGGTGAVIGSGASLAMNFNHDIWVTRTGTDASGCGSLANPCHTIGYILANIVPLSGGSSTSLWIIHASERNDAETTDLLIPPYVFISCLGSDVAGYIRSSGHSIKLGSGWTSNGRGGIQGCYISSTPVNLDFLALGVGSAGSNFMLDDVFITSTFTHTGRGVNGGDFLYAQNAFFFGAASLTNSELQSINSTFGSSITAINSGNINSDMTFIGGSVAGAFSFTQSGSSTDSIQVSGTSFDGGYTLGGTISKTYDNLSLSGLHVGKVQGAASTPTCNSSWTGAQAYTSAFLLCVCNGTSYVQAANGTVACTF